MLTVYGDIRSGNCLKVKWLLECLGRDYHWVETDVTTGVTRSPQFLALNPAGQTPTIVLEDGRPLAQSNAILVHMADGTALIPTDPFDRAKMFEWLFWEQYSHEPCIAVVRFQRAIAGMAKAMGGFYCAVRGTGRPPSTHSGLKSPVAIQRTGSTSDWIARVMKGKSRFSMVSSAV